MIHPNLPLETAAAARERLQELQFELAIAGPSGLLDDPDYVADITEDIAASEQAYVGLAVTEIASLRAELGGTLQG